jgi:hypothetical protein
MLLSFPRCFWWYAMTYTAICFVSHGGSVLKQCHTVLQWFWWNGRVPW